MARFFDVYHYSEGNGRYIRDDDDNNDDVIMTLEDAEEIYNDFCNDHDFVGDGWYVEDEEKNKWLDDHDLEYDVEKDVYISDRGFEYEQYEVMTLWALENERLRIWFYTDWLPDFMTREDIDPDNELKSKIEDFKSKRGW